MPRQLKRNDKTNQILIQDNSYNDSSFNHGLKQNFFERKRFMHNDVKNQHLGKLG